MHHPAALQEATRLVFEAIWANEDTRDAEGNVKMGEPLLVDICTQAGLSAAEAARTVKLAVDRAVNAPVKDALKASVADAVSKGAYGMPFTCITGVGDDAAAHAQEHVWFGSDRFGQMAFTIGKPWYGPDPSRPSVGSAKLQALYSCYYFGSL